MMVGTVPRARISPCSAAIALGAVLAALSGAGCAGNRVRSASQLPAELQAPPTTDVQTLDLSHLAGPPVQADMVERGDVVEVAIAAGLDASDVSRIPVRIGEDGAAVLPEIGPIQLAGLDLPAAEQAVATTVTQRGFYRQPQVSISLRQRRVNRVTVVGAVERPGVYELPRMSSYMLSALIAAGGLAKDAGPRVEIRCPSGRSMMAGPGGANASGVQLTAGAESAGEVAYVCLNLTEAVQRGDGARYLPDGAVVTVEKRRPLPLHVLGLVKSPGQYDFPVDRDVRVLGAIAQAGGVSQSLADKVYVIRPRPDGQDDEVIQISLRKAKHRREENLRLQPGDVVSVEHTPSTMALETLKSIPFTLGASVPIF